MIRAFMLGVMALLLWQPLQAASPLTLEESIRLALENDPRFRISQARSNALQEQAVADKALPDPRLKLGLMNFPTDSFARDQEPMTQIQLGVQQMFPAGDSLTYRSKRTLSRSEAQGHVAEDLRRRLVRDVRQAWLEWFYWHRAHEIVAENRSLYSKLVRITESQYASGRQQQQDVIRAELELGLLDDRLVDIRNRIDVARAELVRYLGKTIEHSSPSENLPALPQPPAKELDSHPKIQAARAEVQAEENSVALARQSYKPSWMLDLTYGARDGQNMDGTGRTDFLSAMVVMDIPLFTDNYQDRKVAAGKQQLQGAQHNLEDQQRQLDQQWEAARVRWSSLKERLDRYERSLLPMARENASTALHGYQSRGAEFNALMRARIMHLETELKALRLRIEHAKTQAQLLYLAGEAQ